MRCHPVISLTFISLLLRFLARAVRAGEMGRVRVRMFVGISAVCEAVRCACDE